MPMQSVRDRLNAERLNLVAKLATVDDAIKAITSYEQMTGQTITSAMNGHQSTAMRKQGRLMRTYETVTADEPTNQKRARRKLSRAERKAIGLRMRKYWAARRKAANGKP